MRQLKSKLRLLFYLILFLALVGGAIAFVRSSIPSVRSISCKSQYGPCSPEEEEKLSRFMGENIFLLSSRVVKGEFFQAFGIKDVYVQKVFPGKLSVFLEKRKPFVSVRPQDSEVRGEFLVDGDGVVLEFVESSSLPLVLVEERLPVVGEELGEDLVSAARLLNLVYRLEIAEGRIAGELKGDTLELRIGETSVYMPTQKDPRSVAGALQLILARSRIDGKLPKTIDLRYSNPVLTY